MALPPSRRSSGPTTIDLASPPLTEGEWEAFHAATAAELRGDARSALAAYGRIARFRGSDHEAELQQLVEHEPVLPDWARARWLVSQSMRQCSPADEERHRLALDAAVAGARWVYRQMTCFELGGLADVLGVAGPDLVAASGPVRRWPDAELGGYQYVGTTAGVATLSDLATGAAVQILDTGSCADLDVGDHAVGRLVPIDEPPGLMAESRLVLAPARAAGEVASSPHEWLAIMASPDHAAALDLDAWHPGPVCTDIPELAWRAILLPEDALVDSRVLAEAHRRMTSEPESRRHDALHLLRSVVTAWPAILREEKAAAGYYAAAALLSPGAFDAALATLTAARWGRAWRELGEAVAEPARARCLALADRSGSRAAS